MRLDAGAETADSPFMKTLRPALAALSCVSILALGACATAPTTSGPQSAALAGPSDDASPYGLFLAGSEAFNDGDKRVAADFFAAAAKRDGGETPFLRQRAFTSALVAGDVHHAAELAPGPDDSAPSIERLGRLTAAVDALADGRGQEAYTLFTKPPLGAPFTSVGQILAPWAAAEAGDWKTALALPTPRGDRLVDDLSLLDNALLLERRHRFPEADGAYRKLLGDAGASGMYTAAYGAFLERRGRRADAIALYQAALKGDVTSPSMKAALDRVQAAKPAPALPTIAQGAAQALLGPTVVLISEKQPELGLAYLRLVLRLDPSRDEAWVLVGDAMMANDDTAAARDAYSHPKAGSAQFIDARARLITTYDGHPDDNPTVLQIAQDTVKSDPGDDDALTLLADALRVNEQYAESAKVLDTLIANQGEKASWQLYYMRGVARQQSGDWTTAEADMKKALTLAPDQPEVLNYLGYSWIDRGERLQEAKAMIEKAVAAKPDSGAMVDSLGWAYFRLGDFVKAVDQLEHAAELEPADPDINNHLGDAYWRAGRKTEARFQWQRVLTLGPDAKTRADVERKLKSGLDIQARVAEAAPPAVP
jgi:tetratricopeptide (TPR) repeat protein